MKKFFSFLIVLVFCMALVIPTFADGLPNEIAAEDLCNVSGSRIISKRGNYEVNSLCVEKDSTLTIGKGVEIKMVGGTFKNCGTINVFGTLDLSQCNIVDSLGDIKVYVEGTYITTSGEKKFDEEYPKDLNSLPVYDGFTLSGGNTWIIITGAAVILGGIVAIGISKKKKKAVPADGEVTVTETSEKTEE